MDGDLESIFDAAMRLEPVARERFLDDACAGDPVLRAKVDALLDADAGGGDFLRTPIPKDAGPATVPASPDDVTVATPATANPGADAMASRERAGERIGQYTLREQLGEGGFGTVWLADQHEPVRRQVALKIIKLGMDTGQVIARFEQERQALALMDHPNIAKVLDAGATVSGRPYFVMELVRGEPITTYCDRQNLTTRERLDLFAMTCLAVQHAHQKGVIHRDLKPSNVLVAMQDGSPVPKVIDFGIAKATTARLTEETMFTRLGQFVGTPEYMSPEQAEAGSLDVDTRSDVYSLGVMLYELLTGTTPFESVMLRRAGFGEIQRIIREEDPPRPSTRLHELTTPRTGGKALASGDGGSLDAEGAGDGTEPGRSVEAIARDRRTDPRALGRFLRGDLDWIVMKALEKDRGRRYESASGFEADVRRYLSGAPVIAAPPSSVYRARKFIRRYRASVATAGLVCASLVIGMVGFAWQMRVAQGERDEADRERTRAVAAEADAEARARDLKLVADFQTSMLAQVDPTEAGERLSASVASKLGRALEREGVPVEGGVRERRLDAFLSEWGRVNATDLARELIDETILRPAVGAVERFADQPVVDAQLRQVLADRYRDLSLYDAAAPLQTAALAARRAALADDHADTIYSVESAGLLLHAQGRFDEASPYLRETLERRERILGREHPETLRAMINLGDLLREQDKLDEAEPFYRTYLDVSARVLGESDVRRIGGLSNMATLLQSQRRLDEAEVYAEQAMVQRRAVLGDDDPSTLIAIGNYGNLLRDAGRPDEAVPYLYESMEGRRRVLGEKHMLTLNAINNYAVLMRRQGNLAEAEVYLRETYEALDELLGPDHPGTMTLMNNLGAILRQQGKLTEAEPMVRLSLERRRANLGPEHRGTLLTSITMASLLVGLDRPQEAVDLLVSIDAALQRAFDGGDAWQYGEARTVLGQARVALADYDEAEADLLKAHALLEGVSETRTREFRAALEALRMLYEARNGAGDDARADRWRRRLEALGSAG